MEAHVGLLISSNCRGSISAVISDRCLSSRRSSSPMPSSPGRWYDSGRIAAPCPPETKRWWIDLLGPERVVLRLSRAVAAGDTFGLSDGDTIVGSAPNQPVFFRERGLVFEADVVHGQKTGHFLDQRGNRLMVGTMSEGRDVLDAFAATGGFRMSPHVYNNEDHVDRVIAAEVVD